jgi:hypothetical protein
MRCLIEKLPLRCLLPIRLHGNLNPRNPFAVSSRSICTDPQRTQQRSTGSGGRELHRELVVCDLALQKSQTDVGKAQHGVVRWTELAHLALQHRFIEGNEALANWLKLD